jgi:hypothetical protein
VAGAEVGKVTLKALAEALSDESLLKKEQQ